MTGDKKTTSNKTKYNAPMADNMFDIVEFLSEQHRPFGVTELSRTLNITTNAVFRLMRRMVERGYAELDPESKGYRLGSKFYTLGMRLSERFDLKKRIRPHLEWLCREVGETSQAQMIEKHIQVEILVANVEVHLSANESETDTEFEKKITNMSNERAFDFSFLCVVGDGQKVECVRVL